MPDWMSSERAQLLRGYGATVVPVSREQGGFLGSIRLSEELAAGNPRVFLPCQFSNHANIQAHFAGTGPEIWSQLAACHRMPDAFVAGVGTGGTVMGVGRYLRSRNSHIRIHPVEPAESPVAHRPAARSAHHRIQGISDEFVPAIVRPRRASTKSSSQSSDGDSILMAQKLASKLGLAVGISSGCNFLAALKRLRSVHGPDATVVATIFCDDNKKYLSTALLRDEPIQPGYLSPEITLTGLRSFPRCH